MAKTSNLILSPMTGGLGNLTTYAMGGKQIVRTKPAKVANPQTPAQTTSRSRMGILTNTYRVIYDFVKQAYKHKATGLLSEYNAFSKENLNESQFIVENNERGIPVCRAYRAGKISVPAVAGQIGTSALAVSGSNAVWTLENLQPLVKYNCLAFLHDAQGNIAITKTILVTADGDGKLTATFPIPTTTIPNLKASGLSIVSDGLGKVSNFSAIIP